MTGDAEQQKSGSADTGLVARIVALMITFGPPVAVAGGLWDKVRDNLVLSALLLAGYWIVVSLVRFWLRVTRTVSDLWIGRVAGGLDRRLSALVKSYRRRYIRQLLASVRDVELLGMATQGEFSLQLKHIYVDVSLAPSPLQTTAHAPFVGTEFSAEERRTLESFLGGDGPRVFAVIGGPGSGKTTLLRHTAMSLGERPWRKRSLPIVLYLRDHVQEILRNPAVTVAELAAGVTWLRGMVTDDWFERCLQRGHCVVMLDGLDEVAVEEQRGLTAAWVRDQVARYPDNKYVLTSRPHGYHANPLSGADVLQVRRFTGDQIVKFVHGWYYAIECRSTGESNERTRRLADEHSDDLLRRMRLQLSLYDLAANPMLLTMIANVHKYRGALPGSRAALYGEMCDLLLQRRQEAKNIPTASQLKAEQRTKVVRELALAMMSQEVRDVTPEAAQEIIGPTLSRIPRTVSASAFLEELTKSGLVVEREIGMYSFAHQTLQEYLAAAEIRDNPPNDLLSSMVENAWWRETILLWAANADASPVVDACLQVGSVDALALAFDCADEAREVDAYLVKKLEGLLYAVPAEADQSAREAHRGLITAVRASRSLRHTVTLATGAVACARPVPLSMLQMYEHWNDRQPVEAGSIHAQDDTAEAVGVPAADVMNLVTWTNGLFEDGTVYRLPTSGELADPMTGVVVDLTQRTVWYHDSEEQGSADRNRYAGPRLFVPEKVRHPYLATTDQLRDAVRNDLTWFSGVLPFVLSYCLERKIDLAYGHDFAEALARLKKLGQSETPALVHDPNHIDRAIARSRGGDLSQGRELTQLIERVFAFADGLVGADMIPETRDSLRELRTTVRRNRAVAEALSQALDIVLTHSLQTEDLHLLQQDLSAVTAGKAARRMAGEDFELVVLAFSVLLSIWQPPRSKARQGQAWAQFNQFATELFGEPYAVTPVIPDAAFDSLRKVSAKLIDAKWRGPAYIGADAMRDRQCWRILARRITSVSEAAVAAIAKSPELVPTRGRAARLGLLAAAVVADMLNDEKIAARLRGVHSSLCCLDARQSNAHLASEVILLIRA